MNIIMLGYNRRHDKEVFIVFAALAVIYADFGRMLVFLSFWKFLEYSIG
jgi:hypothetical protein